MTYAFASASFPQIYRSCGLSTRDGVELVEAARRGVRLFQSFAFLVTEDLREGCLERIRADRDAPGPPVVARSLPDRRDSPRVRAFLDFLQETMARDRS